MSMLINPFGSGEKDPLFANVVFLGHNETTSFPDVKGHTRTTFGTPLCVAGETGFVNCLDCDTSGGNYVQYANAGNDLVLGIGDYTIEFRIFIRSAVVQVYLDMRTAAGTGLLIYCNGFVFDVFVNGTDATLVSNSIPGTGAWIPLAITRASGTTMMFVQGGLQTSVDTTSRDLTTGLLTLGAGFDGGTQSTVMLDEIRISKGIARYTANYTPAVAPFPNEGSDPYAAFLSGAWHFDAIVSSFYLDSSVNGNHLPQGGSTLDTAVFKFGSGSDLSSSAQVGCKIFNGTQFTVRAGDFAVEGWCRPTSAAGYQTLFSIGDGGTDCRIYSSANGDGNIRCYVNSVVIIQGGTLSLNAWHHVRITRVSGVCYLGVDGSQSGSSGANIIDHTGAVFDLGNNSASTNTEYFAGNIDDVRFYKGTGIGYTGGSYTVPTAAFS